MTHTAPAHDQALTWATKYREASHTARQNGNTRLANHLEDMAASAEHIALKHYTKAA